MEAVREFFTLRRAEARAMHVPEPKKDDVARALRHVAETRAGAEALWTNGSPALAVRIANESWSSAASAARTAAGVETDASLGDALAKLGVLEFRRAELVAVDAEVTALGVPGTDGEVTADHARLLPRIDSALAVFADELALHARRPADFERMRRARRVYAIVAAVSLVLGALIALRIAFRTTVTASASYSVRHEPFRVVDGADHTEWLLPDHSPGWIDLHLGRRRAVKQVRLLNTHNYWFHDRGTKQFDIELWDGNRLVKKYEGAFEAFTPTPTPVAFPVSSDGQKISRVRINVKSWFHNGGGLAEVWID